MTVAEGIENAVTMTGAELRAAREQLGLSPVWLAQWLRTDERTLERMESGDSDIHSGQEARMDELVDFTDALVDKLTRQAQQRLKDIAADEPLTIWTFKSDREHDAWANRVARQILADYFPREDDLFEEFRLRAISLLRAGWTPEDVAKAVDAAVAKMPGGGRTPNLSLMPQFPAIFPARWHRQVCARVVERVPEVAISYVEP